MPSSQTLLCLDFDRESSIVYLIYGSIAHRIITWRAAGIGGALRVPGQKLRGEVEGAVVASTGPFKCGCFAPS